MKFTSPIYVFALSSLGDGISGGDRIYIELTRRWSMKTKIELFVWEEGLAMCKRQKLNGKWLNINLIKVGSVVKWGFVINYFYRIWLGIKLGFSLNVPNGSIIFSASEFWMDSIPALILKIRFPSVTWAAAWYQTAPNPIFGFSEGKRESRHYIRSWLYWLVQLPIKPLIGRYADYVLVNNESEKSRFPTLNKRKRAIVLIGAVDIDAISKFIKDNKFTKKNAAVFQGRFHPQKGVIELIDIWALVVKSLPNARLIMIGDGPLMNDVKNKIKDLGLSKNIKLYGYVYDGNLKYKLFSESEIVVHPSYYDSGGMASAEAMAFGLPGVSYDLKSYLSYYPKGLIKAKIGDKFNFSKNIVKLLSDSRQRYKIGREAREMIIKDWSWNKRSTQILEAISK